jgi:hypothetical protein
MKFYTEFPHGLLSDSMGNPAHGSGERDRPCRRPQLQEVEFVRGRLAVHPDHPWKPAPAAAFHYGEPYAGDTWSIGGESELDVGNEELKCLEKMFRVGSEQ